MKVTVEKKMEKGQSKSCEEIMSQNAEFHSKF